ncbi:conserved hypothetical protein [Trichinella spiralis]|uniref:hypothetical protein n=1 Tax=Trichinella spiralis TaxID=6334 RepID=UPI0001EFEEEA|nr:conserved hypothetical protein [Trichinella spiralis]
MGGGRERLVVHFDRLEPYHGTSQGEGAQGRQRERRETRRPAWLQDFIHDAGPGQLMTSALFPSQRKKRRKSGADHEPRRCCTRLPSKAEYGRHVTWACGCAWAVVVLDQCSCDLLCRLLIARCSKRSKRLSGMSSSRKMGGRKVNADGACPNEKNKVDAEPPTMTENPLHKINTTG